MSMWSTGGRSGRGYLISHALAVMNWFSFMWSHRQHSSMLAGTFLHSDGGAR